MLLTLNSVGGLHVLDCRSSALRSGNIFQPPVTYLLPKAVLSNAKTSEPKACFAGSFLKVPPVLIDHEAPRCDAGPRSRDLASLALYLIAIIRIPAISPIRPRQGQVSIHSASSMLRFMRLTKNKILGRKNGAADNYEVH